MDATQTVASVTPELPDILTLLSEQFQHNAVLRWLHTWQYPVYAIIVGGLVCGAAYAATRRKQQVPGRLQAAAEIIVEAVDGLVCGIMGPRGRTLVPFVGTLFIYILCMNIMGLVPFLRSATASLSTTVALALIVFVYVQYTAVRELGFLGYLDHLAGKPRGLMAVTVVFPVFMLFLHVVTELIRPVSLSMRLRGNIWGDEVLLAVMAHFGWGPGMILMFFNYLMALMAAVIQAVVFSLLAAIYFALVMPHEEEEAHA